jgi:flavin-binding protein dodecin
MANTVKVVELMAESDLSWEDASMVALERARKTLRHIRSIDVGNFVALVADGEIEIYQISAKMDAIKSSEMLGMVNSRLVARHSLVGIS